MTSMTNKEICKECGMLVCGISELQLEYNMKIHKKGNKHKKIIKHKREMKNDN